MTDPQSKKRALGKGLGALLSNRAASLQKNSSMLTQPPTEEPQQIPLDAIAPNPTQPRTIFHQQALDELAQSIRAHGVIQPLVVRRVEGQIQLVAGERRLRASKLAGLTTVPVVFQQITDDHLLEITLIENIQREDLNPLEIAEAYQRLVIELGLSHEQIAERTGKDRSTITNHLRLLRLPPEVQHLLADRRLSMGHARALITIEDAAAQIALATKSAAESLSVRDVERYARDLAAGPKKGKPGKPSQDELDPNWRAAVERLERRLGTRVRIQLRAHGSGRLEIDFYSDDDLQRIYALVMADGEAE